MSFASTRLFEPEFSFCLSLRGHEVTVAIWFSSSFSVHTSSFKYCLMTGAIAKGFIGAVFATAKPGFGFFGDGKLDGFEVSA